MEDTTFSSKAFISGTYAEALALAEEARDYMQDRNYRRKNGAIKDCGNYANLYWSCETARVTTRLTEVMAWFFTQRAVIDGEMSMEQALLPENRLGGEEVCLKYMTDTEYEASESLRSLLDRSDRIYRRVRRLDRLLDERSQPLPAFE